MLTKAEALNIQANADWEPLSQAEWLKRLHAAKKRAAALIANGGLNLDRNQFSPAEEFITAGRSGDLLNPRLPEARDEFKDLMGVILADDSTVDDALTFYEIQLVEAAYVFGIIAGSQMSWSVIQAMEPPTAPPVRRSKKAARR